MQCQNFFTTYAPFFFRPLNENLKLSTIFPMKIFHYHSTAYYGPICAMASKSYASDLRNIAKISPTSRERPKSAQNCKRGDPLGFVKLQLVANFQKK